MKYSNPMMVYILTMLAQHHTSIGESSVDLIIMPAGTGSDKADLYRFDYPSLGWSPHPWFKGQIAVLV